jgi:hypothetical protein
MTEQSNGGVAGLAVKAEAESGVNARDSCA